MCKPSPTASPVLRCCKLTSLQIKILESLQPSSIVQCMLNKNLLNYVHQPSFPLRPPNALEALSLSPRLAPFPLYHQQSPNFFFLETFGPHPLRISFFEFSSQRKERWSQARRGTKVFRCDLPDSMIENSGFNFSFSAPHRSEQLLLEMLKYLPKSEEGRGVKIFSPFFSLPCAPYLFFFSFFSFFPLPSLILACEICVSQRKIESKKRSKSTHSVNGNQSAAFSQSFVAMSLRPTMLLPVSKSRSHNSISGHRSSTSPRRAKLVLSTAVAVSKTRLPVGLILSN